MLASSLNRTTAASTPTQQTARACLLGVPIRRSLDIQQRYFKVLPATVQQASSRRASAGSQQQSASPRSGLPAAAQQQHQQQRSWQQVERQDQQLLPPVQQPLLPDPAADDLDLLAAAAAAASPHSHHTNTPRPSTPTFSGLTQAAAAPRSFNPAATAGAAGRVPSSPITSIPDAGPRYALPTGRTPRYAAADKLQLSGEEMRDIGRRLRRVHRGAQSVLRVFRYGIDDLRLYQAIDLAGLEGRVVVVDSTADADAVLTTYNKRTRRGINLATAKRQAVGAGVPLLVLPAVSAERLVEAVGPLLGLPTVDDSTVGGVGAAAEGYNQQQGPTLEPRLLRWDEVDGDGSEELLQLMWGDPDSSSVTTGAQAGAAGLDGGLAGACCPSPRWRAWCAAQAASPGCAEALFAAVRDADVEDRWEAAVPLNPTARAGERHRLLKPLRPFSRIRRRKLRRDLALKNVDW